MLLLLVMLAACREVQVEQGPFVAATATATPRSTPLPPVPTVLPPGTEDNPIRMLINPAESVSADQITDFEEALREQSGLVVEITVVDRYDEALAALFDSRPTSVAVAWLDCVSFQAAVAQNCDEPIMKVEQGRGSNEQTGVAGQIITSRRRGFSNVQAL